MVSLLKKLQNKPYKTKMKILWTAVIAIGVIVIIIWAISMKIRNNPETKANSNLNEFNTIWENIKNINLQPKYE